jgi:hypothetical protein
MERPAGLPPLLGSFERHLRATNRADTTVATYLIAARQAEAFLRTHSTELPEASAPTGIRVCGVGNSARAFTGETNATKLARLDGIRSAVCLWRSAQGGRASCSDAWAYNIVVDPINV